MDARTSGEDVATRWRATPEVDAPGTFRASALRGLRRRNMTYCEQDDHDVLLDDGNARVQAAAGNVERRSLWRCRCFTRQHDEVTSSPREARGTRLQRAVDGVADQFQDQREGQTASVTQLISSPAAAVAMPRRVASFFRTLAQYVRTAVTMAPFHDAGRCASFFGTLIPERAGSLPRPDEAHGRLGRSTIPVATSPKLACTAPFRSPLQPPRGSATRVPSMPATSRPPRAR
jgi:hypothetical protein